MPVENKEPRRPLDGLALVLMPALCLCWGLQPVAIKVAAHGINPVMQIGIRSALATLLLTTVMLWRGDAFPIRDGTFWPGLFTGLLFAGQFISVAIGLRHTTASHMTVFMYTAPVFTALGVHWFVPGERLSRAQLAGVGLAFAGIALAFSNGFTAGATAANTLPGDTLGVLAGVLWATTTILIRRSCLAETPSTKTLLYQLGTAAVLALTIATSSADGRAIAMTPVIWLSMGFQVLIISFVTFLAWLWLLRRYLAARLSVFSFLTPLFGVGFGVLLLHDPMDVRFVIGAVLVLSGIVLVNWHATALSIEGE
jgi:drug/metabolite transporter (DMT)-like permease